MLIMVTGQYCSSMSQTTQNRSFPIVDSIIFMASCQCPKMPAFMSLKQRKCFDLRKTWRGTDLIKKLPQTLGLLRHVFYFWQMKYGTE